MFRVFTLAYRIMTNGALDLPSLCAAASWIVTQRQAQDGHFLEGGPVVMASMQVPTALLPGLCKQNQPRIGGFRTSRVHRQNENRKGLRLGIPFPCSGTPCAPWGSLRTSETPSLPHPLIKQAPVWPSSRRV